ncbi:hypothetical protein M0L20_13625 [Spirosoma sp. RP8]|uniref:TerB family tellurite resistance protein n=1 Tax=Spirosoma liriopis TaxID=2937440 RepID=A0ABT0HL53_9BACT|nr:hypothetical protein [Spirosoma liriopis]MCK8492902.1 hypothetical protein [Spirosoma liriopis]
MNRFILFTLLVILLNNIGLSKNPTDSLKIRMNNIETIYQKRTDSLQKELQFYKIKEDYYSDAMSDQANRFSLLVGGLLALAGLLSWGVIKYEVVTLRKEVEEILTEQMSINDGLLLKNKDDYRRNNFSMALILQTMMQSSILAEKRYNAFLESILIIDLLTQVYGKTNSIEEKNNDLLRLKGISNLALANSRSIINNELSIIDKVMLHNQKKVILQLLNDSILKMDDPDILEDLHSIKANYKTTLEQNPV